MLSHSRIHTPMGYDGRVRGWLSPTPLTDWQAPPQSVTTQRRPNRESAPHREDPGNPRLRPFVLPRLA